MDSETLKDIAVVGEQEFTLGFRLAGVDTVYNCSPGEFEETLDQVLEQDLGIVITHTDYMQQLDRQRRMEIRNSVDPVVVALSTETESADLRAKIKQAIGIDIWKE
ncbi:MAG: V-type ATP synthase subunit F [Candidatus Nanohaloarchaea archaeon]|nr:V-type ATP synthase subunit F [Candidatus Nanohaloarchaea archaeon]